MPFPLSTPELFKNFLKELFLGTNHFQHVKVGHSDVCLGKKKEKTAYIIHFKISLQLPASQY